MSIVTDHNEDRVSTAGLVKIVKEYIPLEVLCRCSDYRALNPYILQYVEDDGELFLRRLMDASDYQLRMYGSARDLANNLKIYRKFPRSMQFFQIDLSHPYNSPPTVYQSLSGKRYICKHDIYVHVQNLILENYPLLNGLLSNFMLLIFLKTNEEFLEEFVQFIEYTEKEFRTFKEEIDEMKEHLSNDPARFPLAPFNTLDLNDCSFDAIFKQFKALIPWEWEEKKYQVIKIILEGLISQKNPKKNQSFYKQLFYNIGIMWTHLQVVVDKRENWFFLKKKNDKEKLNEPAHLRLFEDNGEQFVMIMDICQNNLENDLKQYIIKNGEGDKAVAKYTTYPYDEIKKIFRNQLKRIDFIRTPILRAKHRAVPVLFFTEHCILAADVIIELLRKMIFGSKIFQIAKKNKTIWNEINQFFAHPIFEFLPNCNIFFIGIDDVKTINKKCEEVFWKYLGVQKSPVRDVRNAKVDGFTLKNLQNELDHLSLSESFPDIHKYTEMVYEHVSKNKKANVLRTCDLFDAVELCQMICILKKFPKLSELMHTQKACHRFLRQCDFCLGKNVRDNLAKNGVADFLFDGASIKIRAWDPTKTFEQNTQCDICDGINCTSSHKSESKPKPKKNKNKSKCKKSKSSESTSESNSETTGKLNSFRLEADRLNEQLATANVELERSKIELLSKKKQFETKIQEFENEKGKTLSQLTSQLEKVQQQVIQLQTNTETDKNAFVASKSKLQKENEMIEKNLGETKKKNKETNDEIKKMKGNTKRLEEQVKQSSEQIQQLKSSTRNGQNDGLHEANEKLEVQLEEKDKLMDKLLDKLVSI